MIYDEHAGEGVLPTISHDELWRRLERFLGEVLPVAEASGVQLAAHPDDPPMPTMRRQPRLVYQPGLYQRLIDIDPSPSNKLEFCLGTLGEMTGDDFYEAVESYSRQQRLGYVHFRNVAGRVPQYRETFIDDGEIDMIRVLSILHRNGFDGVLIPDHTPQITCDAPWHAGMAHTLGFVRAACLSIERASVQVRPTEPKGQSRNINTPNAQQGRPHESERVRHAGMPRGVAGDLRRVIRNQHPVEAIAMQDGEHADHVDLAIVDEGLAIPRYSSSDVAKVNIPEPSLAAVGLDRLVEVVSGHLAQCAKTELELVTGAGVDIDETLVKTRLINQARLTAHGWHGRVVWMRGQLHAGGLGDRKNIFQEALQAMPKFVVRNRGEHPFARVLIVDHIPDHAVGNWGVDGTIHPYRDGAAPGERSVGRGRTRRQC